MAGRPGASMAAIRFKHLSISATNLDKSLRFYEEMFGLERPTYNFGFRRQCLRCGARSCKFRARGCGAGAPAFALDVDDFTAVYRAAKERRALSRRLAWSARWIGGIFRSSEARIACRRVARRCRRRSISSAGRTSRRREGRAGLAKSAGRLVALACDRVQGPVAYREVNLNDQTFTTGASRRSLLRRASTCRRRAGAGRVRLGRRLRAQEEPIRIGFSMALTGGLAGGGKPALIAMEIWRDDINAKGGLLGRPVELVYYDDQTASANVPEIYTKLLRSTRSISWSRATAPT